MTATTLRTLLVAALAGLAAASAPSGASGQTAPREIRIDWATYNPVSLVLKERGLLEREFAKDGVGVRWVQSQGSNKALEFLNAGSLDFGSTAGAAALIARINGNPIKSIYAYSRPEWTALVTKNDAIRSPADLKGKRVAVTRGTDPHIFLVRALNEAKLTERDVKVVPLQHADGRLALERGDVDAWAGLDPLMAAAEVEGGARLFHRRPEANSWGVLNVREAFAAEHPRLTERVLRVYEEARNLAVSDGPALKAALLGATKLPDAVIERQLERTDLSRSAVEGARPAILEAGLALREAGVVKAETDVEAAVAALIDGRYLTAKQAAAR